MSIPKQITFLSREPDFLSTAVRDFCDPIISTLGPGGCTVIISDEDSDVPHVTKDGVTVSESIYFEDKRKQAIASLIKEAARKTAAAVGDGTTTSVVLAKSLILGGIEALKSVKSKKDFFDGFDLAFEQIIDFLTESNVPIAKNSELLESVVRISADGDDKVCKLIMSAIKEAGSDGLVNVELHDDLSTIVDIKGGSSLESNTIVPDGKRWQVEGSNIELMLVAGPIKEVYEIKNILTALSVTKNPAIIIAKEFSEAVINTVSVNNHRKSINVALVESEGFARTSRMDLLEDLSAIFSVPIYSTDGSVPLLLAEYSYVDCPSLTKAIITPTETILFRDSEIFNPVSEDRYAILKQEYDEAKLLASNSPITDSGLLRHYQRRMSKYNTVATIKVGAPTKAEALESKDRIDDALSAITAAVNGGITQGGGMALLRAGMALKDAVDDLEADKRAGYVLVAASCTEPFKVLAENSGVYFEEGVPETLYEENNVFDFRDFEVVNYIDGGIIDPALVPISALTNASSVAKTILKSNSIISEWQEPEVA